MSLYGSKVVAVIDTQSAFGVTIKTMKENVDTLVGQMSTLLADAPETLDTLNEIAAAISDDPAFFTTMATANTTLQTNIDALSTAAATARTALQTALQTAIDANALTSTNAEASLGVRLDSLELDPVTKTYVDAAVTNLIDAAPGVLDTLNELAAAIGDDADFITTVNSSIAAVQADVDANEAAALTARNAIQADVDANEVTAAGLVTAENTAMLAAVAVVQADVDANETASDAAEAALSTRLDTLEADPTTATAVAAVQTDVDANQVTAANAVTAQNTAMLAAVAVVQADVDANESDADTAIATKFDKTGGVITGSLVVAKSFPDLELKANDEKRLLFTDAGGGGTGAIKHVGTSLDFYAGGIASGNKEFVVAASGVTVTNNVTLTNNLTNAANDSAAATAGVAVNQLYRNGSVVMIRVS